jgi:hypothetical protein
MAGGLTLWDPLAEITQLRSRFDRLLDELGGQDHGACEPRTLDPAQAPDAHARQRQRVVASLVLHPHPRKKGHASGD